jgi:hypothetical protein
MSGRVNIEGGTPLFLQEQVPLDDKTNYFNATKYIFQPSELSNAYFSKENINKVHNDIKKKVYELSQHKYVIDDQDTDVLKVIMRSIFLQYSKFQFENIKKQIDHLNSMVIEYSSNNIFGEIHGYLKYKEDASNMYTLMDRPVYLHNDNTLELKTFF